MSRNRVTMGLIHVDAIIAHPGHPRKTAKLTFLVDSGAIYSVVPKSVLRRLGVKPHSKKTFTLADGSRITRDVGGLLFRFDGQQGASPVIFGEKGDSALFGIVSLEALGFMLDPIRRELCPLPLVLGNHIGSYHIGSWKATVGGRARNPTRQPGELRRLSPGEVACLSVTHRQVEDGFVAQLRGAALAGEPEMTLLGGARGPSTADSRS